MAEPDPSWARLSLRITCAGRTVSQLDDVMGVRSTGTSDHFWTVDLVEDSDIALDDQLRTAKAFLRDKEDVLVGLDGHEVNLSISWTPRAPQDGVQIDTELVALLFRTRCYVLLDTYLD